MTTASVPIPTLRQDAQIIGSISVAHGVSHFFHLIIAPLFPWLKDAFNVSYIELGFLMTMFFVVSGVGQVLAGFVVDRLGARNVLFFGLACLGTAAMILAMAPTYSVLLIGSMLAGLGNSVFHPADFVLLNKNVSSTRLGHAFSVHTISGNLGWAAAPLFLITVTQLSNWRIALFGAAIIPFAVLGVLIVYRKLLRTAAVQAAVMPVKDANPSRTQFDFTRLPAVWMSFGFFFITALASSGVHSFSTPGLRDIYGMSLSLATAGFTAYMLASAAGTIWGGFLASKTERHDRTIAMAFIGSGLMALTIATGMVSPWMAVALMGAVGFGGGVAGPSRDFLIRNAAPKNAIGRVYGFVYSGLDVGMAIAPLLFGALMDASRPALVFIFIGLFQMAAILTAVGIRSSNAKSRAAIQSAA
jgi:FSR family fosmidomycin resistance protein-like MFS transporter